MTPFASRARERALHAAFVIIARHTVKCLSGPKGAAAFAPDMPEIQAIRAYLLDRFTRQDPSEAEDIERHLESIIERWANKVAEYTAGLSYSGNADAAGNLLIPFEAQTALLTEPTNEFPTMNQMRNVDAMCGISVLPR